MLLEAIHLECESSARTRGARRFVS